MKIHYISDHAILEYDEVQLLLDLGHEVFSNGAYIDPNGHITLPRPALKGGRYYSKYADLARSTARTAMPPELIDPFDVIIVMHSPNVLVQNWENLKHKKVIWRSIGQSVPWIERALKPLKDEGLIIVRYSPKERHLPDYIGEDALIRFYKDEAVYQGWDGAGGPVVSFAQSLKGRREFCHFDEIMPVIENFKGRVYGPGNEDLAEFNGGSVPYEQQLEIMRTAGAMPYGGTWPAAYTLSFIEALMMGLPVVAISKTLAHIAKFEQLDFYEVDELMGEISAPVGDSVKQMIQETAKLINNPVHATIISERQRALALKYFSKAVIAPQWQQLLESLR